MRHTLRVGLAALALTSGAIFTGACSDDAAPGGAAPAPGPGDEDAGGALEDAAAGDASTSADGKAPPPPKDSGADASPDAHVDAGPPRYDYGKAPLDESCWANGNASSFKDVQLSADGSKVLFQRCDAEKTAVLRDLASGKVTVIGKGGGFFAASAHGALSAATAATTELTAWDGASKATLPVAVDAANAWRVWQASGALKFADKTSGATSGKERLVFTSSSAPGPSYSQEYDVLKSSIASVVLRADGGAAASLERYPSELKSRLRVASFGAGASVTTYELDLFEPRWVRGGAIGDGALVLSGMNGTQQASRLYFVRFDTGAVTAVSTGDVIPRKPPQSDDVPGVAIAGGLVYFLTGDASDGLGSPNGKTATLWRWDPATPTTAATMVARITNAAIYSLARYSSQGRPLVLSGNGEYAYVQLADTVISGAWHAIKLSTGAASRVSTGNDTKLGGAATVGTSNYQESDTKFLDLTSNSTTSMTRGTAFISPDGATFFSTMATSVGSKYTLRVRRRVGTAAESTIVDLPQVDEALAQAILPVRAGGILVSLPRNPVVEGQETKHDLYVFP